MILTREVVACELDRTQHCQIQQRAYQTHRSTGQTAAVTSQPGKAGHERAIQAGAVVKIDGVAEATPFEGQRTDQRVAAQVERVKSRQIAQKRERPTKLVTAQVER